MTTILTPVDELKAGDMFCIGAAIYTYVSLFAVNLGMTTLTSSDLRMIFPDGVPVIVPDKPKEVRVAVKVHGAQVYLVDEPQQFPLLTWLVENAPQGKVCDLVLTEWDEAAYDAAELSKKLGGWDK